MTLLQYVYFTAGSAVALFFLLFAAASVRERKYRAAVLACSAGVLIVLLSGLGAYAFFGRQLYFAVTLAAAALGILLFFAPFGRARSIKVAPSEERVDERDTMFAREDYVDGTDEYREYYRLRPENKQIDDRIRRMPGIGEPGGRYFDPHRSAYIISLFKVEDRLKYFVDGGVSEHRVELPPEKASALLKELTLHLGADEVGIGPLDRRYVYSHVGRGPAEWGAPIETGHTHAVMFTVEMSYDKVEEAPGIGITEETAIRYLDGQKISIALAQYIRDLGYSARAHVAGSDYQIMMPPVAYDAGLGELGRNGYLISPRFGARIRLGGVTTDMPLATDGPIAFGVQHFCEICKKCADNCPSRSIPFGGRTTVRGVDKWPLRTETCFMYWRHIGTDCGLCMKVCPFSHPDTFTHDLLRQGIKRSAFARRISLYGDDLFYGRKTSFPRFPEENSG